MALYAKSLKMRRPAQPRAADRTWQVSSLLVRVPLHSQDSSICIRHDRIIHLKPPWDWISAGQGGATQGSVQGPLIGQNTSLCLQPKTIGPVNAGRCNVPTQRNVQLDRHLSSNGSDGSDLAGSALSPPSFSSSSATSADLIGCPSPHIPPRPHCYRAPSGCSYKC
jgi:hypothetical protein